MLDNVELLSRCLDITRQLVELEHKAMINIKIGEKFVFMFDNQENIVHRNKSPSQKKRDLRRKYDFQDSKLRKCKSEKDTDNVEAVNDDKIETKVTETQTEIFCEEVKKVDSETQFDSSFTTRTVETNTDADIDNDEETESDHLEINEKGEIHPRKNENILEMRISHNVNNSAPGHWAEVESYISEQLKFTLIGKPWIANNGNRYMTIGFRTFRKEYENWKLNTFNWQGSNIRAVTFSRLYR